MSVERLESMAGILLAELRPLGTAHVSTSDVVYAKLSKFFRIAISVLPDHSTYLQRTTAYWLQDQARWASESVAIIESILDLVKFEQQTQEKISELKLFASAEDKVREAGKSFSQGDYSSVMNSLNTAVELALKDKLDIPTTIMAINTSKIIDVLVSRNIGPILFLSEVKKYVVQFDNKTKHQGFNPSKLDCINAMKAMDGLMAKLKTGPMNLSDEAKRAIYEGL